MLTEGIGEDLSNLKKTTGMTNGEIFNKTLIMVAILVKIGVVPEDVFRMKLHLLYDSLIYFDERENLEEVKNEFDQELTELAKKTKPVIATAESSTFESSFLQNLGSPKKGFKN